MPCNDVTEMIELRLDQQDRVAGYRLVKRTCGRAVGSESLLAMHLAGREARAVLALDAEALVAELAPARDVEAFLILKHLFAVQEALRALLGEAPCGPGEACAVASVSTEEAGGLLMEGYLSVDVLTERIEACGACRGCASRRVAR